VGWVNPGFKLKQVTVEETLDPVAGCGLGDIDTITYLLVSNPSVHLHQLNNLEIEVV
jgi:hypothetical protein